ncbi:MAG: glycosyltransferase family 2 protein [Desulfobulbus sp.]|nr:glycosyltransferase family 2 protein [Desulfobulbus sp.]
MKPFITIVMPVYNEGRFIEQTLRQLFEQEYPADRYEILVADGMSTDKTREIVQALSAQYSQIRLLDNPKRKSSAGRNVGFQNGRGEYFLVVDGHCYIPNNHLLTSVAECFRTSGADCLGRPQPLDPPDLTPFQQAVALARGSRLGHGGDSLIYSDYEGFCSPVSNGAAYARHVFEKVGYVDEQFDACEDVEFNYRVERAGMTCYTSPKLTIQYYPRENLGTLWRQMVRYGEGRFRFIRKHPKALTVNQLIPVAFAVGLLLVLLYPVYAGLLGNIGVLIGKILFAGFGLYFIVLLLSALKLSIRKNWMYFVQLPCIFFCIHAGLGLGFIKLAVTSSYRM